MTCAETVSGADVAEALAPPLKYAGGKRWLLPRMRELYAPHRHRRLVEPFVGGMSVALGLRPERALLADANRCLIWFYQRIRCVLEPFSIEMVNDEAVYYRHRARFNELLATPEEAEQAVWVEAGELLFYLNRTCFNGLMRFNRSGGFNVPFGKYKNLNYKRDFSAYAACLEPWEITHRDFSVLDVHPADFVFIDPPYDGTFSDYASGGFAWDEQERLACQYADHPGPVVATNQATPRIVELYRDLGYSVELLEAPRSISASGNRAPAIETLATRNCAKHVDMPVSVALTVRAPDQNPSRFENEQEGEEQMAFLPKGWGAQVADAEATIQRQRLKDGEYLLLHKSIFRKDTQNGSAIIIEHKIIDAKKIVADVDPLPVGSNWGHFMPEYGKAKVMLLPNMKAYALGLLGVDEKKVSKQELADTIDAISDERQSARGMLIKGVTFHTKTEDGEDFLGMNWYPVPGENVLGSPNVLKRRAELDAELPAAGAPAVAPPGVPGAPPSPPGTVAAPSVDSFAAALAAGWVRHETAPGWYWNPKLPNGQNVKSEVDLRAGR